MTMIEKMARAICKKMGRNPDEVIQDYEGGTWSLWVNYQDVAKAALECLKEPTQVMIDKTMASELSSVGCDIYLTMDEKDVKEIYGHMINAALEGK